ncbi:DUF4157 domain-containing protein [Corallococcus aberystwythensis]|uniref:DUF4157 domain-containing protein n=2 Tax=Corallococcus aberystwythensis TaxID=2316722 RepID=A0A3A8QFV8_9BACT|nr:DUF4157 domain-containing protein [Corallococcus aberystwythensis]
MPVPPIVDALPPPAQAGSGRPLPVAVRQRFESGFGEGLGDVRLHEGTHALPPGMAALTVGTDLYFAPGHPALASPDGLALLAHELVHVLQQRAGRVPGGQGATALVVDSRLEHEADLLGALALQGRLGPAEAARFFGGPRQAFSLAAQPKIGFEFQTSATFHNSAKKSRSSLIKVAGLEIAQGQGFQILCDEGDLEFRTDPFEESTAGRAHLMETLKRIQACIDAIKEASDGKKLSDICHTLSHTKIVYVHDTAKVVSGRPQASVGVRLGTMENLMKFLTDKDLNAIFKDKSALYEASRAMAMRFVKTKNLDTEDRRALRGLVSLFYTYVLMGGVRRDKKLDYPKKNHPLMHRTDFHAMYQVLSPTARLAFQDLDGLLGVLNKTKGMLGVMKLKKDLTDSAFVYPGGFTVSGALTKRELQPLQGFFKGQTSHGPTLRQWMDSIVNPGPSKKDLMSPPPGCQAEDSMGALGTETVGPYGDMSDGVIVEVRHMNSATDEDLPRVLGLVFDSIMAINGGYNAFATTIKDRFPTEAVWQFEHDAYMALREDDL